MSEIDLNKELKEELEKQEGPKEELQEEPKEPSPIELEARGMGHVSKDEWEAQGKDPDEWVSPREYVRYGKLQRSMHTKLEQQQREFDGRLDNLNQYHEAQRKIEIKRLRDQQKEAVEFADTEKYDKIQTQIDEIEKQPIQTETPQKEPEVIAWEKDNPWIYDPNDNRSILANAKYNQYYAGNPNASIQDVLNFVDKEVTKAFPKQNMKRETAQQTTETSSRQTSREPKKLSMNDLSFDERQFWNQAGQTLFAGNQEAYLQSVADARKGE